MGAEENITEVAKSTLDAYKSSPMLTGLLLLNLVFLVGFGYFLQGKNAQHEALVARILDEEKQFRNDLVAVVAQCSMRPSSGKPGYFPQIQDGQ